MRKEYSACKVCDLGSKKVCERCDSKVESYTPKDRWRTKDYYRHQLIFDEHVLKAMVKHPLDIQTMLVEELINNWQKNV